MALILKNPGLHPVGIFDGVDSELSSYKGGEVVTFTTVANATDLSAGDVTADGYLFTDTNHVAVTRNLVSSDRPLMLADEGVAYYGTTFGRVVGGTAGRNVAGSQLGPNTTFGSGKVTCWDKPGLYAVTLDAVDTTAATGLTTTNTTLTTKAPLYPTATGLLTPNAGAAVESVVVARFISFETSGSLVSTQSQFVSSLNKKNVRQALISFNVEA